MQAVNPGLLGRGRNDTATIAAAQLSECACALNQRGIFGDALIQPGTFVNVLSQACLQRKACLNEKSKACLTQRTDESARLTRNNLHFSSPLLASIPPVLI